MRLVSLVFTGPNKPDARVEFNEGVNVVYGASDTGKSFIVDAIDFMLGGGGELRDIDERVGYDRLHAKWALDGSGQPVEIIRAISGGEYSVKGQGAEGADLVLKGKAHTDKTNTLSAYFLTTLNLFPKRVLQKVTTNKTGVFTLRDLVRNCVVPDARIDKPGSPFMSGQRTSETSDYATLRLLLTGVDDSALVGSEQDTAANLRTEGKIELLQDMIERLEAEIEASGDVDEDAANEQFERIEATIARRKRLLTQNRVEVSTVESDRRAAFQEASRRKRRIDEIDELIARFALLDEHYANDLERLQAIQETGSYFSHLPKVSCPLCGAAPDSHGADTSCAGDTDKIVIAALAEIKKIIKLKSDLSDTSSALSEEREKLSLDFDQYRTEYNLYEARLNGELSASSSSLQEAYQQAVDARTSIRAVLAKFERRTELQLELDSFRKAEAEEAKQERAGNSIPKSVLDRFAQKLLTILKAWDYPNVSRIHFDEKDRDFVINGKSRGATGRGLRAITHAASTIALMEYCQENDLPHPGFVVMDSPLLAYFEPEGDEDDLSGTDLKLKFYEYLIEKHATSQIIIIENTEPPKEVIPRLTTHVFTKNPHQGRYGLFPYVPPRR